MIKDIDLDVRNYFQDDMSDDNVMIYLHTNGDTLTKIVCGEIQDILEVLLDSEELHDLFLSVAAYIVVDKDVDFDKVLVFAREELKK